MSIEIISTVLAAAQPSSSGAGAYDLTDLATVLDELQIEPNAVKSLPFLKRGITQISAAIAKHCNRVFQVETIRDEFYPERDAYPYQVPGGVAPLQLSRWPVLPTLVSLTTSADVPSGAILPFVSTAGVVVGMPVHAPAVPPGGTAVPGIPFDAVVRAIEADVSVTISLPLTQDLPTGTAIKFGPRVGIVTIPGSWTDLALGTDYKIDADNGQLIRLSPFTAYPMPWDPMLTVVRYQGGYDPIPPDLVEAALRVITSRNDARGRDPYLKSMDQPGIGSQTFWVGGLPGVKGMFSAEIEDLLDDYRVPVVR